MHTIGQHGQHKRLSLAREEGDPTGSDFGGAGSGSGLFRHKLSPAFIIFISLVFLLIYIHKHTHTHLFKLLKTILMEGPKAINGLNP